MSVDKGILTALDGPFISPEAYAAITRGAVHEAKGELAGAKRAYEAAAREAPDLAGRSFVSPYNAITGTTHANDYNGHGTHVAGTIGQSTNNGLGVAGIAYGCSIMPVKGLNSAGSGSHAQIANGITWAADHGAKVINLSLGGSTGSTTLSNAITYAWGRGVVICAATGNTGRSGVSYPARYTNCIARRHALRRRVPEVQTAYRATVRHSGSLESPLIGRDRTRLVYLFSR